MMQTFKIQSPNGTLTREYYASADVEATAIRIKEELKTEEWYKVEHHECYHDEGKPCKPWALLAEKGESPQGME